MLHWGHRRRIDRYFAGQLGASGEAQMRARLERCDRCRAHYERHLIIEAALAGEGNGAADRLWASIRHASARPRTTRAISRRGWPIALAAPVVVAAVAILVAVPRGAPTKHAVSEPVARGRADVAAPALHVFHATSAATAEPLSDGASIRPREGLLFAYSNGDPALTHVMVFAVDAEYGVHWYYPAYASAGEDPTAVPVVARGVGVELGEEIRHDLPPGPLRVVALFLREPHHVLEVEDLIRREVAAGRRPLDAPLSLPVPGSIESSLMLRVVR